MIIENRERLALQVIDIWLDYRLRYGDYPGYQICIRKKGEILFSKAYGYANLEDKRPLKKHDLFHIASHSKTFTACAFLRLVEQGSASLSQLAIDYLPELKNHRDKRFREITLRDLLSNRSGIFRDGYDATFWELEKPFLSREQLLQGVLAAELIYEPNTETKYSNIGFSLLGVILENIVGSSYQEAMNNLVLKDLNTASLFPDYDKNIAAPFADGHSRYSFEGKRLPLKHAPAQALAPAAGFCANAESTSLFFHELLLGERLVSRATQRELLSLNWPVKNSSNHRYGLGVQSEEAAGFKFIGHSGGYPGFITETCLWIGTDYVISSFTNTNDAGAMAALSSIAEVMEKIKSSFTDSESKEASVSGLLMNKWGARLYVVTSTKALSFRLDSWRPCEESLLFESKRAGEYICHKENGYGDVGENLTFMQDKDGNYLQARWGGSVWDCESLFLQKFQKALMKAQK